MVDQNLNLYLLSTFRQCGIVKRPLGWELQDLSSNLGLLTVWHVSLAKSVNFSRLQFSPFLRGGGGGGRGMAGGCSCF